MATGFTDFQSLLDSLTSGNLMPDPLGTGQFVSTTSAATGQLANYYERIVVPDIHQGTGFLWYNVVVPNLNVSATGAISLDQFGTPAAGAPLAMGATEGPCKIEMKGKIEEVAIDQETGPVDAIMTAESAMIECSLKETTLAKVAAYVSHSSYSNGTSGNLPSGSQAFEQLTAGGLVRIPARPVALVSPRRGAIGQFLVFVLFKAVGMGAFDYSVTRTKESVYKVTFTGLADMQRPQGQRMCSLLRNFPG